MALAVCLLGFAAPALAATQVAGVDVGAPAAAFKAGRHVFVYPDSARLLDGTTEAQLESALAGSSVYVSVLETPRLGRAQAKPVSDAIATAADRGSKASFVLVGVEAGTAASFLQVSSPVKASVYGLQIRAAINAHHGHPGAQALQLGIALAGDKPAPAKSSGSGGTVIVVVLVVALLLLALIVWWRQRRRQRVRRRRLADARVETESLADDLLVADPAGRVALRYEESDPQERALRVAWSRLEAAQAMLSERADTPTIERARGLTAQGRAALEHALRLRDGVPDEAEVLDLARRGNGPDPSQRFDQPQSPPPVPQRLLPQWTAASYPGYGYGWYPGFGYGFFGYGGSFITGLLAGELIADAFSPWGGYGGFGGYSGYDVGFDSGYGSGYDAGYGAGVDQTQDGQGQDFSQGDDPSFAADTGAGYDAGSYDSGSYDSGSFDSGGDFGSDSGGGGGDW
jgi:hypothetical protein